MQQALYRIADQRAQRSSDPALHEFVSAASARILRSVRKDEIATFVGLFGASYKSRFNSSLDDRDVTVYNNAASERHNVAHRQGSTIAFMELRDAIAAARKILVAAEVALT
jgi:hypothetical protein